MFLCVQDVVRGRGQARGTAVEGEGPEYSVSVAQGSQGQALALQPVTFFSLAS